MKKLLMTTIAIFGLVTISMAQLPSYVPSNGLVGWWPLNGDANDESINNNVGNAVNIEWGIDRYGNTNSAANFNLVSSRVVEILNPNGVEGNSKAVSIWFKMPNTINNGSFYNDMLLGGNQVNGIECMVYGNYPAYITNGYVNKVGFTSNPPANLNVADLNWHNVIFNIDGDVDTLYTYIDGVMIQSISIPQYNCSNWSRIYFGKNPNFGAPSQTIFAGSLDDIGIWNRPLTQQEISNLFNSSNCSNNLTISPETNLLQAGSSANFNATTSDSDPSFVWQSDFGQGFQTLNNYGNYSGVNSNSLSISNVQLSEHNQPIRVISTSGECFDTSNVATINIADTCIVTINDTITTLISVTDTLVINTLITGLTPPNNSNTIKVFPNPANSHITIDFGNFESMNGYTLTITNSVGQTVYTTPINEQSSYIDLSTWSGNGIYFVQIIDTQNNTIENLKIVLQ